MGSPGRDRRGNREPRPRGTRLFPCSSDGGAAVGSGAVWLRAGAGSGCHALHSTGFARAIRPALIYLGHRCHVADVHCNELGPLHVLADLRAEPSTGLGSARQWWCRAGNHRHPIARTLRCSSRAHHHRLPRRMAAAWLRRRRGARRPLQCPGSAAVGMLMPSDVPGPAGSSLARVRERRPAPDDARPGEVWSGHGQGERWENRTNRTAWRVRTS